VFTSLRPVRYAPLLTEGDFWSASGHLLPPGPPQMLPAGAREAGWVSHPLNSCTLSKAHTRTISSAPYVLYPWAAETGSSPGQSSARNTSASYRACSRPAACTRSILTTTWSTFCSALGATQRRASANSPHVSGSSASPAIPCAPTSTTADLARTSRN